jgi:hypothetical protein
LLFSRSEFDASGAIEAKRVEEVFERFAGVLHLHVTGQVIRTTHEHPFYAHEKGWLAAKELQPNVWILSENGDWKAIKEVYDTGEWELVYNLRVADFHTYFVGDESWGWAAWAHNTYLVHYTDAAGLAGILTSKTIFASTGNVNARYGDGQYFTDILPSLVTGRKADDISDAEKAAGIISIYQLAQRLYGMPWKYTSVQYYVIVDMEGLTVSSDAPHVFHVPNTTALSVSNRISSTGKTVQ